MIWSMRRIIMVLGIVGMLLGATSANADSFNFSISGTGISASGTFTTNSLLSGSYLITGISGTQDGMAMTLIAPNGFDANDNLLFATAPQVDFEGVSFLAGGIAYNLYYNSIACCGGPVAYFETTVPGVLGPQVTFSAAPAPEPASLLLLGVGFAGLLGWRKAKA
jgi:hypothetical protein